MNRFSYLLFLLVGLLCACSAPRKATSGNVHEIEAGVANSNPGEDTSDLKEDKSNSVVAVDLINSANQALLKKYAAYLQVPVDSLTHIKLYEFIDKWLDTPYKWGGISENGIDCSAFIQRLLNEVYELKLPRTSIEQLYTNRVELFRSVRYLSEGDIVFFRTVNNRVVSHVGIYLHNNRFIHACLSKGVTISSLKEPFWKRRYVAAGRIKAHLAKQLGPVM